MKTLGSNVFTLKFTFFGPKNLDFIRIFPTVRFVCFEYLPETFYVFMTIYYVLQGVPYG